MAVAGSAPTEAIILIVLRATLAASTLLLCTFTIVADRLMSDPAETNRVTLFRIHDGPYYVIGTPVPGTSDAVCSSPRTPAVGEALLVSVQSLRTTNPRNASPPTAPDLSAAW